MFTTFICFPRRCLCALRLDEDEAVDVASVSVSESIALYDCVFSYVIIFVDDELEENQGYVGSNRSNCSLGCF